MKTSIRTTVVSLLAAVALITSTSVAFAQETKTLKEALKDKFLIGTAVNTRQASGRDKAGVRVIQEQFNAIVAENCMKSQEMHPKENRYNFTQADGIRSQTMGGRIICCGVGSLIGIQTFINIAVATQLFPTTGIPLPFVSYGLTSLISLYIGIGLVLNVGLQPKKYQ